MSELLTAALQYAKDGWYVFPIKPYVKRPPLIKDQFNNSSRDEKQIREWWGQAPMANIGLDCGKSGVDVVDIDVKHKGILAVLEAMKIVSGGSKAWSTRIHETPSGGFHYIFKRPPEGEGRLTTVTKAFGGAGIDTRSVGGYIVLPPSVLAEYDYKKYRIKTDAPLLRVPPALIIPPGKDARESAGGRSDLESLLASKEPIKDGERNQVLHRIASKLIRIGFAESETLAAILAVNTARCVPPYNESDIVYMVKKAYTYYTPVEDLVGDASKEQAEGEWNDQDQTVAVTVDNFLNTQKDGIKWLVDGILPMSSLNMIQGNPKSGKSTLARYLAVGAAQGTEILGIPFSTSVPVLYYSLQESKEQWKDWLLSLLSESDARDLPMHMIWRLGRKGPHATKGLRERILKNNYQLVIIDMISRFLNLRDMDKYSEVEGPLSDLNEIAQETGACIVWLHHERKSGGGFEAGIGSQALRGAVYTTIRCERDGKIFSFSTEQREGNDIDETTLALSNKKLVTSALNPQIMKALGKRKG